MFPPIRAEHSIGAAPDTRQGALLLSTAGSSEPRDCHRSLRRHGPDSRQQPTMLAVISTGNELIEPGEPILPHQVRRSNAYAIVAALRRHGFSAGG